MRSIITITPPPIIHHANENAAAADGCLSDLGKEMAERIGKRISEETKDDRFVMYSADSLLARHIA